MAHGLLHNVIAPISLLTIPLIKNAFEHISQED